MPPRVKSADNSPALHTPEQIAAAIEAFFSNHPEAAVLEDGKAIFALASAKFALSTEHERCSLQLWSDERNMVRRIVSMESRGGALRLATLRFGQTQTKLLELVESRERRTPTTRDSARTSYVKVLERVLQREFAEWKPDGLRSAMDLEKSFGPAYARGSIVRGKQAWAVIGVNAQESISTIDGILTLGILWLHDCRERAAGKRLYQGLKVIVPRGSAMLTLSRMAWLNTDAAQWELWELDEKTEEMEQRDPADQGNLRTRLVHHADEEAAAERFAAAIDQVMQLVPAEDHARVERRLRGPAELAFLLHGLEFARARIGMAANSFGQTLELTVGVGPNETPLNSNSHSRLAEFVGELFERRRAFVASIDFGRRGASNMRRIGAGSPRPAHSKMQVGNRSRREQLPALDPLYRACPERWLESVLRCDLAPLTRGVYAPDVAVSARQTLHPHSAAYANDPDPDSIGNRADPVEPRGATNGNFTDAPESRVIPRLDPRHVYSQVPAIAGASDRGMLDLLGVTADGRLAVIELKVEEDLQMALQGLDYWIRVRHHHLQATDAATGMGEFQRHGYFRGLELSPLAPRLYLVMPALHVHPVTEIVLRYLSPRVEWHLLALDERWRQTIRVVWRKQGGKG